MVNSEFLQGIQGVRLVLYVVSSILMVRSCMSSISPHIFRLHNPVFSNSLIVLHMLQNAPVFWHFDLNIFHLFTLSSHMFPIFSHEFSWFSKRVTRYEGREGELIDLNDEIEKSPPSYSYSGVPWPFHDSGRTCGEKKPAKLDGSTIGKKDLACVSHEEMQISLDLSLRNWDFTS